MQELTRFSEVMHTTSDKLAIPLTQRHNGSHADNLTSMEDLRDEIAEGLLYAHSRANANTSKTLEVASFAYALIELLIERELISEEELDERKRQVGQRLVEKFVEKGMGVALTKDEQDKYGYEGEVQIDCENRLHLCRGACCKLRFALSVQDLEEGSVKWDLGHPYMIRHGADGYCHHMERATCRCGVYAQRPIVCRSYDCRKDKRIWADFAQQIVSSELESLLNGHSATNGNGHTATAGTNSAPASPMASSGVTG